MARKEKKFHYIYKTTCSVTNRYYIGIHSTDNLDDNYLGSGKILWFSLNYHGKENHTKEILKYCDTREVFIKAGINNFNNSKEQRVLSITKTTPKYKKKMSNDVVFKGKKHSDETKRKMSESKKGKGNGSTNSQFGSCWITNEIENKKIM